MPDFNEFDLRNRVHHILKDPQVRAGILSGLKTGHWDRLASDPTLLSNRIDAYTPRAPEGIGELEQVVIERGRPALLVQKDTFDTKDLANDLADKVWKDRLETARTRLESALPAVGRINLRDDPTRDWAGTCWLVAEDIVVTNRHVADLFAYKKGEGNFAFKENFEGRLVSASVDFVREYRSNVRREFPVTEILHIEAPNGPDIALLRISTDGDPKTAKLAAPVPLADALPAAEAQITVIGYPARDSQIPDPIMLRNIFKDIYNVKRMAPGAIVQVRDHVLDHDASTLGGNSGSLVFDVKSAEAVGLHFGGSFKVANYAVPSPLVKARLAQFTP